MDDPHRATPSDRNPVAFAVAVFYVLLFAALVWPVYPWFATIEPRVLAMPFSLFYVVVGLLLSFLALFGYYLWERSRETAERDAGGGNG